MRRAVLATAVLLLLGAVALWPFAGASRAESTHVQTARFSVPGPDGGTQTGITVWPRERAAGERFPIVIAFHGMTEARSGPQQGFLAWPEKYGLIETKIVAAVQKLVR